MKNKKIIFFIVMLSIFFWGYNYLKINAEYHGNIEHFIETDKTINFDGIDIKINDYNFYQPGIYYRKYSIDDNSKDSLYVVINIEIENNTSEDQIIDLSRLLLVKETWCDFPFLEDLYHINQIDSYIIKVRPGYSGELELPYRYYVTSADDETLAEIRDEGFKLYCRIGYPFLNESYVYQIKGFW